MAQTSSAVEVSSIGTRVLYCVETTAGTRPTSGYTFIPCITAAPSFDNIPEQIDCSDLGDDITQYLPGRQDPGGDAAFTANITTDFLDAWDDLVTAAATAKAAGKRVWFEYKTPNFAKSFFWSGEPVKLGHGGLEQNAVQTVQAHVIPNGGQEWAAASTNEAT